MAIFIVEKKILFLQDFQSGYADDHLIHIL